MSRCNVKWSSNWPDKKGYWWVYRPKQHRPISLVHVVKSGNGKILVATDAEFLYEQQDPDGKWRFAQAEIPVPPPGHEEE